MSRPYRILHAESGGSYLTPTTAPKMKLTPAELPLTLTADVLRLPYPPAVRLVLAEIISLHACNAGLCDASDTHFADRLTISRDTASRAVQQLEADGLLVKHVVRLPTGFYRTLAPVPAAIQAKAETNPYPQNAARNPTRNMPVGYPQNAATPSRNMPVGLAAKSGSNTSTYIPLIEQPTSSACAPETRAEEATGLVEEAVVVGPEEKLPAEDPNASASHTGGRRAKSNEEPPDFAAFYAAYPKREKRKEAVAAFRKLRPEEQAQAADKAAAWFAARPDLAQPERRKYIPLAASWLNAERWTDDTPLPTSDFTTHASPRPGTSTPPAGQISKRRDAVADAKARIRARYEEAGYGG